MGWIDAYYTSQTSTEAVPGMLALYTYSNKEGFVNANFFFLYLAVCASCIIKQRFVCAVLHFLTQGCLFNFAL